MSIINKFKNFLKDNNNAEKTAAPKNIIRESDHSKQALYRFSMDDLHALMRREEQEKAHAAQLRMEQERQEELKEQQAQTQHRSPPKVDWSRRVILADISTSMGAGSHNGKSRYTNLHEAIQRILINCPMQLVAFSVNARPCRNVAEMEHLWRTREGMGAGNNEINALHCAQQFNPEYTLLISDGGTYDADGVINYVKRNYPGTIDALYIGPSDNHAGISFLRKLVSVKGGRCDINDLSLSNQPALEESMKSLILRQL